MTKAGSKHLAGKKSQTELRKINKEIADLKKKHFRRKRGTSLVGGLVSWGELREKADKLKMESWSRTILTSGKLG